MKNEYIIMGNQNATMAQENLSKLSKETEIKAKDLKKMHKKFLALDTAKKGYVSIDDITRIPEIEKNPLRYYICQYLSNQSKNEEVSFEAFIKLIDVFKSNKTAEQYKFVFELIDFNKDGKISAEDLLINLKLLLGNSLNEEQISEIVDKTIAEYSSDQKTISYDEFLKIITDS